MKRFFLTVVFCTCLLAALSLFLFPTTRAAENPLLRLLNLPAPPPPNPQVPPPSIISTEDFFNKSKPPPDDASIESLMEYWRTQAQDYNEIRHKVYPSEKVLDRLMAEIAKDPTRLGEFLNIFPPTSRSAEFVKGIYDSFASGTETQRERRSGLKRWMKYNTPYFSTELARDAARVSDTGEYVTHHDELVALARVDWDRANPIVSRLYNNPGQKASRTAALWALYLHAIEDGSPGDTERYRDELKEIVADKSLSDGIRDLALDALSLEKEWGGRDEWYLALLEDETLLDLGTYTGLTTLISSSPEEKYIDRMLALLESDNINVRTAAARNLLLKLSPSRPDVVRALLPWLGNPKWLRENTGGRSSLVMALSRVKVPESVPGLIAALDERELRDRLPSSSNMVSNANVAVADAIARIEAAANAVQTAANTVIRRSNVSAVIANTAPNSYYSSETVYPLRYWAIAGLAFQEDPRAVPALRRILGEVHQPNEQYTLVGAILKCGGFSIAEQVGAIEDVAKNADTNTYGASANANMAYPGANMGYTPPGYTIYDPTGRPTTDIKRMLGIHLAQSSEVGEELARSVVDRITSLDRSDVQTANAMRKIVLRWRGPAVNALLLRDLKNNRTEADAIVRLLSVRRELREKQQADIFGIRTGGPIAVGISACLLEDHGDFEAILEAPGDEAKTAMLACARLIRAALPIRKVAESLHSKDKLLALAAERYLESEDSPEARSIVLALHPNEARIMGATTAFYPASGTGQTSSEFLAPLFASVGQHAVLSSSDQSFEIGQNGSTAGIEKRLQEEVKREADLLGVYNWEKNYIRIYKDKALVSWDEDTARYRERTLTKEEFDNFKGLIAHHKADELPPFLNCTTGGCVSQQLLMIGRNGGRRVFVLSSSPPPLFAELERAFAELRRPPSHIKYWASKDVPGLEVLFADERMDAMAVWKNGADFRLLTADKVRRAEIENELESFGEQTAESDDVENGPTFDEAVSRERSKREYENFAWHSFGIGGLGSPVAQPVDYIPLKDTFPVPRAEGQWKARTATIEIRADQEGLYKIAGGKFIKIRTGSYRSPVITPNGRWAIVSKYDDDVGIRLVRVNLLTNREYVIEPGDLAAYRAIVFVPSVNRVLVGSPDDEYSYEHEGDEQAEDDGGGYALLDPETGLLIPARGEIRPLVQQTFRPLQAGVGPFEFWAAIPRGDETVIGVYNTRNFNIKPVLKLPKISFDSMKLWVDGASSRIYFVYEGHLLSVPIKSGP